MTFRRPMGEPSTGLCLGIDGGQTATRAAAVDAAGELVATIEAPGLIHPLAPGGADRLGSVLAEIRARLPERAVTSAFLALTGVESRESPSYPVAVSVAREVWPEALITIDNDGMAAWAGGTAGRPGVAAMAGTGSVVIAVNETGSRVRTGGWGPVLGDAGGGWRIGLAALQQALRHWDAGHEPSPLDRTVLTALRVTSPGDLPPAIGSGEVSHLQVVRLAALVGEAAAWSAEAAAILSAAANEFAQDVAAAMSRLDWRDPPVLVVPVGNVYRAGPAYIAPFELALVSLTSVPFILRAPILSGVGGAVLLARRQSGLSNEGLASRLAASGLAYEGGSE